MRRILVGVDDSEGARQAAKLGEEIARATGSQLVIASAVAPVSAIEGAPELIARAEGWRGKELEQARALVSSIAASVGTGVAVETLVAEGSAAVAIAELARSGDVDMVVVGHRGRNAISRALLGSVADRLVQICPKPVLIAR